MNEAKPEMVKSKSTESAYSLTRFAVEISTSAGRQKAKAMRKQLLKGLTMLLVIMTLAMVTAVASANGQTQKSKANIPFAFVVGDKNLPAGEYALGAINASGDVLRIRAVESQDSVVRLTRDANGKADHAKLVFHRYGARYFLAQVWTSRDDGHELTISKEEKAIQKDQSRIGSNKPASPAYETVEISARQ